MAIFYSAGIRIEDKRMSGFHCADLHADEAREFQDAVRLSLDAVRGTPMGAQMMAEIDRSGHQVSIFRTWKPTAGSLVRPSYFADAAVVPLVEKAHDGRRELAHVLDAACQDLSDRSVLARFFGIGKPRPRYLNRDAIARLVNVSTIELKAMELGLRSIDTGTEVRLRAHLYDFLTPGPGCNAEMELNHTLMNTSEEHKRHLPASEYYRNRPLPVVLAHELVHAWRLMTGRVIFPYGWEEEAMTVGLPPFSTMKFTENRFRIEFDNSGLALRPEYQLLKPVSNLVEAKQLGIDPTTRVWQGNPAAVAARARPGKSLSPGL